ncbi:MAG: hypothetical protein JWP40_4131 [Blastococcus sp.]|jgi:hypothetical protein|nr:hypothetical protein [Blastococcus sp.]
MSDEELALDVRDELFWDPRIDGRAIAVTVVAGAVTLRGTVGSFRQRQEATMLIQSSIEHCTAGICQSGLRPHPPPPHIQAGQRQLDRVLGPMGVPRGDQASGTDERGTMTSDEVGELAIAVECQSHDLFRLVGRGDASCTDEDAARVAPSPKKFSRSARNPGSVAALRPRATAASPGLPPWTRSQTSRARHRVVKRSSTVLFALPWGRRSEVVSDVGAPPTRVPRLILRHHPRGE